MALSAPARATTMPESVFTPVEIWTAPVAGRRGESRETLLRRTRPQRAYGVTILYLTRIFAVPLPVANAAVALVTVIAVFADAVTLFAGPRSV